MPSFETAGRVGVQPAAESRHVQRHNHAGHVLRALHARLPNQWKFCMHAACATATARPAASRFAPRLSLYVSLSTRQSASSFNQALSLDTSSVTSMFGMFYVRSTRAIPHFPVESLHAHCLHHRNPTPSHLPARASPRTVCLPFDSAGRVIVQPAAESRHVQRHNHAWHVLRALPCTLLTRPPPPLSCPGPHLASHPTPHAFRLGRKRRRSTSR